MKRKILFQFMIIVLAMVLGCGGAGYKKVFKSGVKNFNNGDYKEAIKEFSIAISLNPEGKEIYFWRAKAYFKSQEYPKVFRDLTVYMEKTKKVDPQVYLLRAEAYQAVKKYKQALQDYNQGINLEANAEAYHKRGLFYIQIGAFKRAKSDLKFALKLDEENAVIYCDLGKYYFLRKQYKQAIKDLETAVELREGYALAHYFLGRSYLGNRDKTKALEQCQILNKLDLRLKNKLFHFYLKLDKDSVFNKRKY